MLLAVLVLVGAQSAIYGCDQLGSQCKLLSKFTTLGTYPCCLEDLAQAGEILNPIIEGSDGVIKQL